MAQHKLPRVVLLLGIGIVPSLPFPHVSRSAGSSNQGIHSHNPHTGTLTAAAITLLAQHQTDRVIVVFKDQHAAVSNGASTRFAVANAQASVLNELAQVSAPQVNSFHLINAIAATVSYSEAARLSADPAVAAVVPDAVITLHRVPRRETVVAPLSSAAKHQCNLRPELDPQALQLTHTASDDPSVTQAQHLESGKGVVVAILADGIDPNNPDFLRADGTSVFTDYQDFSGDGPNAPTSGVEAFGDASSIAAQGRQVYNVNRYVNVAHQQPIDCPQIRILGMSPGASLMGLKVFGQTYQTVTSNFILAIQYAVDHGANVINQSFDQNVFPDSELSPINIADDAAVAAGVTVVASTGDAGTQPTIGSPASDPNVISVGASTAFRVYKQIVADGFQLSDGGYLNNNISSLSSSGPSENIRQGVDVVAPGDLGWTLCSTDVTIFQGCTDLNGNPSPIQVFGGTSESAPLTAGEAALVIQAYRDTHGGANPTPRVIKQIIMGTAMDLSAPTNEQGSGLINSYRAVLAAQSYRDVNGDPAPHGHALLASPNFVSATGPADVQQSFSEQVTNVGTKTQTVRGQVSRLGAPFFHAQFDVRLSPAAPLTFSDEFGTSRAAVEQDVTVPAGAQRLDAAIAWDVVSQPGSLVRLTLLDPKGRYAAFSLPQDPGGPSATSGYGHVAVRYPLPGVWHVIVWTIVSATNGFEGLVHVDLSESRFKNAGSVSPDEQILRPGQTGSFLVRIDTPDKPGDQSLGVYFSGATRDLDSSETDDGTTLASTLVPVVLRSLVPIGRNGGAFSGTFAGGNGRYASPGQVLTYAFDVPAGLKDLDLSFNLVGSNSNVEGVLVTPDGRPIGVQSTVTSLDASGQPASYTNTMQFFRRQPEPGRWNVILFVNNNVSGSATDTPFKVEIQFNIVKISSSTLPDTISNGGTATATLTVTNTGNTTKDYFVDPRLAAYSVLYLGSAIGSIPLPSTVIAPVFTVPPDSIDLTFLAESAAPSVPISMNIETGNGAPPYGATVSPAIEAVSFVDPSTGDNAAIASSQAPEVVPGLWSPFPSEVGPFPNGATPTTVQVDAYAVTQQFDLAVHSNTGDAWAILTGVPTNDAYAPLTLAPGATGTINVTISPVGAPGTVVNGVLYVDTFNANSAVVGTITGTGDEVAAIPYSYTIGASIATSAATPASPTSTATTTSTVTPALPTRTVTTTATSSPTITGTVSPSLTVTFTATSTVAPSSPTTTATSTVTSTTTPTASPTTTVTASATSTATVTTTPTVSPPSPTLTATSTATAPATATATATTKKH